MLIIKCCISKSVYSFFALIERLYERRSSLGALRRVYTATRPDGRADPPPIALPATSVAFSARPDLSPLCVYTCSRPKASASQTSNSASTRTSVPLKPCLETRPYRERLRISCAQDRNTRFGNSFSCQNPIYIHVYVK